MTLQLGELLESVYRGIHDDIVDGVATGGSATTIVDTTLSSKFIQNRFKDWIAFISRTADGASPQGKYGIISSYVTSSKTITLATLTDAVESGDEYSLCKGTIPLQTLIKLCNDAMRMLGTIWVRDISLTTAEDTLTYTLPAATKGKRFYSLELMDSDNRVYEAPNYEILKAAGGATNTLRFKWQPTPGYTIVINYPGLHPKLTAYNSYVEEAIHPELAVAACVERALHWKTMPKQRASDMKNWNMAKQLLMEARQLYPIEKPSLANQRVPIGIYN